MITTTNSKTTENKEFSIAGVPCFKDTIVPSSSSVLLMKISDKTPRHRNPLAMLNISLLNTQS